MLFIVGGIPLYGYLKEVNVFDSFVDGAKGGLDLVFKLLPFLIGMIVAVGMLRASGAFDMLASACAPLLKALGIPEPLLPLGLLRPFSGAASNAVLVDLIKTYGPDAMVSKMAATLIGSTETTFYVVAIYFGAVRIKYMRHAMAAGLIADFTGLFAAVYVCRWLLG